MRMRDSSVAAAAGPVAAHVLGHESVVRARGRDASPPADFSESFRLTGSIARGNFCRPVLKRGWWRLAPASNFSHIAVAVTCFVLYPSSNPCRDRGAGRQVKLVSILSRVA